MKRWAAAAIVFLTLLVVFSAAIAYRPEAALAQEPPPISIQVEVGFEGKARVGHWTPVVVELENQGPDFEGELRVSDTLNSPQSRYTAEVILPQGGRKRFIIYIPYLAGTPRLEVELVSKGKTVASLEPKVNVVGENDLFIGVLGQRVGAWNLLTALELPGQERWVVVAPLPPESFPERPEVLDAFDVIALGGVPVESLSPKALEAIEGWVAGGGILLISGGANGRANLKGLPEALLPVVPGEAVELSSLSVLEQMGGEPLPATPPLIIMKSRVLSGRILLREGDIPLAVLRGYGKGGILFLSFDPVSPPLSGWGGVPRVWKKLLFQSVPSSAILGSQPPQGGPWGTSAPWRYNLFSAVSNLPALEFPSINLLVALIAGYVLLVGPVNYLLLRKLRRSGLAWGTIPALALLFSSGMYFLALQVKGSVVQSSVATIVEVAPGTEWARIQRMVGIIASSEDDYHVDLPGEGLVSYWDADLMFRRPPGGGGRSEVIAKVSHREDGSEVELLKMGAWTMRSLWTDTMKRVGDGLSHNLYLEGDRLKGTVSNEGLISLKEVWLVGGGVVEELGTLNPGDIATVDVKLVDASPGLVLQHFQQQINSSPPSGDPRERRRWEQRRQVLMAAIDSRYAEPPSSVFVQLIGWTDESPPEIAVNGTKPTGSSLTVFIEPVIPELRGSFSLPGDLLLGRVVEIDAIQVTEPGLLTLGIGSVTYQFELPPEISALDRMAIRIPFLGSSLAAQGIQVSAYRWDEDTWEPLELKTVKLSLPASPSTGPPPPGFIPPPPPPIGGGIYSSISYGLVLDEALEGELSGEPGFSGFVSPEGLVRIKLTQGGAGAVELGTPSLVLQGAAGG